MITAKFEGISKPVRCIATVQQLRYISAPENICNKIIKISGSKFFKEQEGLKEQFWYWYNGWLIPECYLALV